MSKQSNLELRKEWNGGSQLIGGNTVGYSCST